MTTTAETSGKTTTKTLFEKAFLEDLFGMPDAGFETWKKMTEQYLAKTRSCLEELGNLEGEALEQTRTAIRDGAELLSQSLTYTTAIQAAWREQMTRGADALGEAWKIASGI